MLLLVALAVAAVVRRSVSEQAQLNAFAESAKPEADNEPCCCDEDQNCYDESGEAPDCCFPDSTEPDLKDEVQASALEVTPVPADQTANQILIDGKLVETTFPVTQGHQFTNTFAYRQTVTEIVVHESNIADRQNTVDALERPKNGIRYGTHFMIDFDGSVWQHGDLARGLTHAGDHNKMSLGIEIVNPYFTEIILNEWLRPPVKVGYECKSKEHPRLTTYRTTKNEDGTGGYVQKPITKPQHCLTAALDKGYPYFIFGKGSKAGKCYAEKTSEDEDGNICPEGWEEKEYDFYKVEDSAIRARWAGRKRYVLPSKEQCESLVLLLQFLTNHHVPGKLEIPLEWAGLVTGSQTHRGKTTTWTRLANNKLDNDSSERPGILAHQYCSGHGDGSFEVLYAYLRLEQGLDQDAAYAKAKKIGKTIKFVTGFPGMDIRDQNWKKTGEKVGRRGTKAWRKYYKPLAGSCWNID